MEVATIALLLSGVQMQSPGHLPPVHPRQVTTCV